MAIPDDGEDTNLLKPIQDRRRHADEIRNRMRQDRQPQERSLDVPTHADSQARDEREIFRQFSEALGSPQIDRSTIQSKVCPEPDIFCVVASQSRYFELQAITSTVLAKAEKGGPGVVAVGAYSNEEPFKSAIMKKVTKPYVTQGSPVDLVLHYVEHPAPPDEVRQTLLFLFEGEIEQLITRGPFARVWLFSAYGKTAWLIAQRSY